MVTEISLLKEAVESQHGGTATFAETKPVTETWQGKTVWKGTVHIYDLVGHELSERAYAWSEPVDGSDRRTFYAVLHVSPVDSAKAAVKASIVHRNQSR